MGEGEKSGSFFIRRFWVIIQFFFSYGINYAFLYFFFSEFCSIVHPLVYICIYIALSTFMTLLNLPINHNIHPDIFSIIKKKKKNQCQFIFMSEKKMKYENSDKTFPTNLFSRMFSQFSCNIFIYIKI